MNHRPFVAVLAALLVSGATATPRADVAIVGGTVIDGTGAPGRRADVVVSRDRIVAVVPPGSRIRAAKVIDAAGMIVTPGFIDSHAHGNPLEESLENFLLQGATTVVLGQDGVSPQDEGTEYAFTEADWRKAQHGTRFDRANPVTLKQWLLAVGRHGSEVNVAPLVGLGTIRKLVGAGTEVPPTPQQLQAMIEILRGELAAGAFGSSSGLEYVPGRYMSADELRAMAQPVGAVGGVIMSHMRSEDDDKIAGAIDELTGQAGPARVNISHLKIVFAKKPEEADAVLAKIAAARARGIDLSADVYPFYAGYADMSLVYPAWAKRRDQWDEAVRTRRAELEAALRATVIKRNGPGAILIASGEYAGLTLEQVAAQLGLPFEKVLVDTFGFGGPEAAHRIMLPAVQDRFVASPDIAISTDGAPWMTHPRSWGSYPQVLEEFVMRRRAVSWETAIHKMTGLPARTIGLADRGRVAAGMKADLVVIDPAHLHNNATWTAPKSPPGGFVAVLVNGRVAARNGKMVGRFGRALTRTGSGR